MNDLLAFSAYFGVAISLVSYTAGCFIKEKTGSAVFNPLIISVIITITFLSVFDISYETYYSGAKLLGFWLTPATVCLAVPLYEKLSILKKNFKAVSVGIVSGVLTSMLTIFLMAVIFRFDHAEYVTFLPKSVTTAIGVGVSAELGGYEDITTASIIITGVLGNLFAPLICRLARITEPIAKGVAIGSSSHAMGTARAMEMGETEGAMSGLSIAVAGLLTVVGATVFSKLI